MRVLFSLLLIVLSSFCYGQDVTKERLVSFSKYINGAFQDSTRIHYSDERNGISGENNYFYNQFEYWNVVYDSVSTYYAPTKPHSTRFFERNESLGIMDIHFELRDDSIPKYHYITKETIQMDKKRKNVIEYSMYNILPGFEALGQITFYEYDEANRLIRDSSIGYNQMANAINYVQINTTSYYENGNFFQRTYFNTDTLETIAGRYSKEFYNPDGALTQTDRYEITDSNSIVNYEVDYNFNDSSAGTYLQMSISIDNDSGRIDTTYYYETKTIDSILDEGKLEIRISKFRTRPDTAFTNLNRTLSEYSNDKIVKREFYSWDSITWQKRQTFKYQYDKNNQILELFVLSATKQRTQISPTATKYTWRYSSQGNIQSRSQYQSDNYGETFYIVTSDNYYYEPYLQEEKNLSYTQLIPLAYPNPFVESTNILFSVIPNKAGTITISNLQGEIMQIHNFSSTSEIYQYNWRAGHLPKGIYFAKIVMGNEVAMKKLIKE